ncbi:MAG: hypothetical protein ACI4M3_04285 [Acutalibacteraceae bacterium]
MTESEFEEFVITLGMQYYKPDSTAYGRIDGFETILRFSERQGRYVFLVGAGAEKKENEQELNTQLSRLAASNNKIFFARFENHTIQIDVKMTVNSEIDRTTIRESISKVFGFCKDLKILPFCKYCGQQKKTGFFTLGGAFDAMCEDCFNIRGPVLDKKLKKRNQKCRFGRGLLGSIAALILSTVIYVVLYLFNIRMGLCSIVLIAAALFAFVLFGKRHTAKSVLACMALSWLFLLAAEYISYVAEFAKDLSVPYADMFWAVDEAIRFVHTHILTSAVYGTMLVNIAVGTGLILILGALFALGYKAFCRPYIKSEKIA